LLDLNDGEILSIDPQPLRIASGEVEEAMLVAVAEIAAPIGAVADATALRLCVVPVALEERAALEVHDLADRLAAVQQNAVRVEPGAGAFQSGLGIHDPDARRDANAERAARRLRRAQDGDAALRGAIAVEHLAAEALRERRDVHVGRLAAEGAAQRIVRVVSSLRR